MAELDLHKPLDLAEEPKLEVSPLKPDLAVAALTLHGDYYRQMQSRCNSKIFWHSVTQAFMIGVLGITAMYQFAELWEISDTMSEFWLLVWYNKYLVTNMFPSLIFVAGTVGITSFLISDELRVISDKLADDRYILKVFRFPLRLYANNFLKGDAAKSAEVSSDVMVYRKAPIAIVTVIPEPSKSDKQKFFCRITGLHVRKVYKNAGLENELLALALEKARVLAARYKKDNRISGTLAVFLDADAYSFDPILNNLFLKNNFHLESTSTNFEPLSDSKAGPYAFAKNFFGIRRNTYQLEVPAKSTN